MKSAVVAGFLASVFYSQQAVASTYGWNDAQSFSSPQNCNNTCSSDQSGGYNWGDVPTGPINNFDGFDFSGFNCESSFNVRMGKRGLVRRTQFSGKAIVAQATTDDATCPRMSGQSKDFSITEMHVSVDKDSQLTFEYDMPDGSVCKQQSQCSVEGSVVKNTQCGGAQQVRVKGDCNFGFHSIIFDCQPGTSSSSSSSSTSTTPVTTATSSTTTVTSCASTETTNDKGSCVPTTPATTPSTTPASTTPASTTPVTTTPASTTPVTTTPVTTTTPVCAETESKNDQGSCVPKTTPATTTPATTPATTTAPASTTPATTPATTTPTCSEGYVQSSGSCVPQAPTGGTCATTETLVGGKCIPLTTSASTTAPTCGADQTLSGTGCVPKSTASTTSPASSDLVTTEIVYTTLTSCPVTVTSGSVTSISLTLSTTFITSTVTFCPKCGESPTPPSSPTPTPTPTPPTCAEGQELQNGQCVPQSPTGGTAPPSTSTPAATTSCQETETFSNGACVPKTPTGGSGTPTPTPPVCNGDQELQNGQCVPKPPTGAPPPPPPSTGSSPSPPPPTGSSPPSTGVSQPPPPPNTPTPPSTPPASTTPVSSIPTPQCQEGQVQSNGQCIPKTPTGGVTSQSTTVNAPPPETPVPEAPCPSVLPRCLSTWMSQAGSCSSNSDISCFCPSPDFISSVQECVAAWSGDDSEVQAALSYLVGICAKFVPQNPGICTGVPSTITLVPTPAAPTPTPPPTGSAIPTGWSNLPLPTAPPFTGSMPSTVITFTQTITSGSTITQTVTVPQVVFNTVTQQVTLPGANGQPAQTQAQGVGLVPALPLTTPPAGPAAPTPVAGQTGASSFVPSSTIGSYNPGASGSQTGPNSPIQTFTGSGSKTGYGIAAGILGLVAFLA